MTLQEALKQKNMSIYRLSKVSKVPYATINDIYNNKTRIEKCSAETVFKLARALEIPMEELIEPYVLERGSFENFKSTICHRLKEQGDIDFIITTLESQEIRSLYTRKWYAESLYLLGMLDYISRENGVPRCDEFDDIRQCKLEKTVYPASLLALAAASNDDTVLLDAETTAIPEFKRFNIIENEVRNVI